MTATENYLQQIGYNGDIDDLDGILDFINEQKHIFIETRTESSMTSLGPRPLHQVYARVYHIPFGRKDFITETPPCAALSGALRLSVLYAARYLANIQ